MQMATTMAGQAVVPKHSDLPRILTGFEKQMAEFTFSVRAPEDLVIVAMVSKYQRGMGESVIQFNPLTTVIYRSVETYRFGCFHIPTYQNQIDRVHETFSFRYQLTKLGESLHPKMRLHRGDLIAHSPNHRHGGYGTGLSTSVVYMATPYTIEDGFEVSRSFVERASPIATGVRRAEFGRRYYPLNMYPNPNHPGKYMPFPNIGDRIRDDGIVFALRKNDPYLAGLEMTNRSLQDIDFKHDRIEYGEPGAVVVDVTVTCGSPNEGKNPTKPRSIHTPQGMDEVALIYENQIGVYYGKILDIYYQQKRENHNSITLTPEFQTLIEFAMGHKPNSAPRMWSDMEGKTVDQRTLDPTTAYSTRTIQKTMKAKPIDEWFVEIIYAWEFKIGVGSKVSDLHGGK